jgi:caffeoyl-CoA O-methyltransferase
VIVVDNVLRYGRVVAPKDAETVVVAEFNAAVQADPRVEAVMIPLADGVTLARKL